MSLQMPRSLLPRRSEEVPWLARSCLLRDRARLQPPQIGLDSIRPSLAAEPAFPIAFWLHRYFQNAPRLQHARNKQSHAISPLGWDRAAKLLASTGGVPRCSVLPAVSGKNPTGEKVLPERWQAPWLVSALAAYFRLAGSCSRGSPSHAGYSLRCPVPARSLADLP